MCKFLFVILRKIGMRCRSMWHASACETPDPTPHARAAGRDFRTWSPAGSRAVAHSHRHVLCKRRFRAQHFQHLLRVFFPVGGAMQIAARRDAATPARPTSGGWIRRRLLCRALCHGSGKNTCTPASEAGAIMCVSTSTASCWISRRLDSPCSPICFSRLPTPGVCTSTPMKFFSGMPAAICALVSPMPKPISRIVGAARPNA